LRFSEVDGASVEETNRREILMVTYEPADPATWHLLVVANETLESRDVRVLVALRSAGCDAEVLVVAPALARRLAYWATDDREARRAAEERLRACLDALEDAGVVAEGVVGDADPLLALADALAVFAADEILIATHPPGTSSWLERDVVMRARQRFNPPVHHLVVQGERLAA
jgi:GABA permease